MVVNASTTLLSDGRLLVSDATYDSVAADLYDPGTRSWTTAAPCSGRTDTPATLLLDGTVLVAGGNDCLDGVCVSTGSAELYVPQGEVAAPVAGIPEPAPASHPDPDPASDPVPARGRSRPPGARPGK